MKTLRLYLIIVLVQTAASICPPTGPVLPPPVIPSNFSFGLNLALDALVNSAHTGRYAANTSFSVMVTSKESTFFSYHYTSVQENSSGTNIIDEYTTYRIASVTKVFTVLAVLLDERM